MTRSTVTPWRANQASARLEEGDGAGLALVGQDLGVGEARGIVDGDVQVLPADAACPVTCRRSPVMRWPMPSILPSFLVSMWISSPGRSRW